MSVPRIRAVIHCQLRPMVASFCDARGRLGRPSHSEGRGSDDHDAAGPRAGKVPSSPPVAESTTLFCRATIQNRTLHPMASPRPPIGTIKLVCISRPIAVACCMMNRRALSFIADIPLEIPLWKETSVCACAGVGVWAGSLGHGRTLLAVHSYQPLGRLPAGRVLANTRSPCLISAIASRMPVCHHQHTLRGGIRTEETGGLSRIGEFHDPPLSGGAPSIHLAAGIKPPNPHTGGETQWPPASLAAPPHHTTARARRRARGGPANRGWLGRREPQLSGSRPVEARPATPGPPPSLPTCPHPPTARVRAPPFPSRSPPRGPCDGANGAWLRPADPSHPCHIPPPTAAVPHVGRSRGLQWWGGGCSSFPPL